MKEILEAENMARNKGLRMSDIFKLKLQGVDPCNFWGSQASPGFEFRYYHLNFISFAVPISSTSTPQFKITA